MIFKDYYKILGLETPRVSIDEIKSAYRMEAKKYHPDVNVGNEFAEERIKDINEAYRVLSDSTTKRKYDRKWNSYLGKNNSKLFDKTDSKTVIKNIFFGSNVIETEKQNTKQKPKKGENINTLINLTIEEAFYGTEKQISLKSIDGRIKKITIKIPEGIKSGESIRLIGQGKKGENGGKSGDLIIKVKIINSKNFMLKGNDIETNLFLTPWEAALGTRIEISIFQEKVKVYIPQGVQSSEKITIPGKGYLKGNSIRGNLIVNVQIAVPKKLTAEEKELFNKLSKISKFRARAQD